MSRLRKLERAAETISKRAQDADFDPLTRLTRLIQDAHGNLPDHGAGNDRLRVFLYYMRLRLAEELPEGPDRDENAAAIAEDEAWLRGHEVVSTGLQNQHEIELFELGLLDEQDIGERMAAEKWRSDEEYYRGRGWLNKFSALRPDIERATAKIGATPPKGRRSPKRSAVRAACD